MGSVASEMGISSLFDEKQDESPQASTNVQRVFTRARYLKSSQPPIVSLNLETDLNIASHQPHVGGAADVQSTKIDVEQCMLKREAIHLNGAEQREGWRLAPSNIRKDTKRWVGYPFTAPFMRAVRQQKRTGLWAKKVRAGSSANY